MHPMQPERAAARDQVGRAVGVIGLISIALIHLLDGVNVLHVHVVIFALYLALMAGTFVVAAVLLRTDSRLAWSLALLMAGLTFLGFVLSRTSGLPGFRDEVGNWLEPLGLSSLFVEGSVVLLAVYKVATTPPVTELVTAITRSSEREARPA